MSTDVRTWWSSVGWPPRVTWFAQRGDGLIGSGNSEFEARADHAATEEKFAAWKRTKAGGGGTK